MRPTDREADPISEHSTRRNARPLGDARARRYALRAVKPSPARQDAPEPDAWLPIDLTEELAAIDFTGELELIAIEEGRVDLDRELEALESDFWSEVGRSHPDFAAPAPTDPAPPAAIPTAATPPAVVEPTPAFDPPAPVLHTETAVRPSRPAIAGHRRTVRLRRRILGTVAVVAVMALAIGGLAQLLGRADPRRDVQVSVDGEVATVATRARTVGDLLAARGITVNSDDRVVPALGTPLEQGMPITIHRAFPITLDVDGTASTIRTTRTSLGALRRELDLPAGLVRVGEVGAIARGSRVVLRTPKTVELDVDGKVVTVKGSTVVTVRGLLASRDIEIDEDDLVQPALNTRLTDGMQVAVMRVTTDQVVDERIVPFKTEYRDDASLWAGHTRTIQAGRNGLSKVVSRVVRDADGEIVQWTEVHTVPVREPVTQILARGTKPAGSQSPPAPPASSGGSGGATSAPSGGRFFQQGLATHYASHAGSGACAHLTLPFGTIVRIVNTDNGRSAQCRVGDRGPEAWTGRIIDLNPDVFAQLAPLGTGVIPVKLYIL